MVVINMLWVGSKLSRMEYYSIKSFIKVGYEIHLWCYEDIENVPQDVIIKDGNLILNIEDIFLLKQSFLPFSDIFRYKMLYELGGYWADIDMICLKRFDTDDDYIISSEYTMQNGAYKSKLSYVSNIGILKSPKNSLFYKDLYNTCSNYQFNKNNNDKLKYMKIFRKKLVKYEYEKYIRPPDHFCPVSWWNSKEAFMGNRKKKWGVNPLSDNNILNNSYCIHFWRDKATKTHKLNLDKIYNQDSLWEKSIKKIDS